MRIGIIGGGFTGLSAAYWLTKRGHTVHVFERDAYLGGLAWGFQAPGWKWHLEAAYHHLFTNDDAILGLARELGLEKSLLVKRPVTANLYHGKQYQFDSPKHLLGFPFLSPMDKIRTGVLAAFCKLYPFWQSLEGVTAHDFALTIGGKRGWEIIWEPLMTGKFGAYSHSIGASWLWARIHKRTPSLVYIEGGFQTLVRTLASAIEKQGGTIQTGAEIKKIETKPGIRINGKPYDRLILTTPTPIAYKLVPEITNTQALTIPHLFAQVLVLETTKPILKNTYWLSITDREYPFLAVVAHTNFVDRKHYGGRHLTYIGNYLPQNHSYLTYSKEKLLGTFIPYLKKLAPAFTEKSLHASYLFVGPYAQPVHQLHYSKIAPPLVTPITHVYLANMDSIYPWDRGTNYAVALGQQVADAI